MKYFAIFALLLVALVAFTSAQSCPGRPRNRNCRGTQDLGRSGSGCTPSSMWYFDADSRECRPLRYLGCDGNRNRHCTRAACLRKCLRRNSSEEN